MSSFICSDATTNALAQLASISNDTDLGRQRVAELLRAANAHSVNSRYSEGNAADPIAYEASATVKRMLAVQVLKLCACFDYQCSDADRYSLTEAARIVEGIRHQAIHRLPGYEDADWDL